MLLGAACSAVAAAVVEAAVVAAVVAVRRSEPEVRRGRVGLLWNT